MITIIYTYRNREPGRIKKSLDSLSFQTNKNFKVIFVDYGSELLIANEVASLMNSYPFVQYNYLATLCQPWNKSKALNYALKKTDSDFCFVADVDMIFHDEFVSILFEKKRSNTVTYFKVGFLSQKESAKKNHFHKHIVKFHSTSEATGMSLLPVMKLKEIHGYDEFFHFWGAEDTDLHNRLYNSGCVINYYDEKVLMLHQWHPNYRKRGTKTLNKELQIKGIVELNHNHLLKNQRDKTTNVNPDSWGNIISEFEFKELESFENKINISNKVDLVTHFLFIELPQFQNGMLSVRFVEDSFQNSLKYKIKKIVGKKVPNYYSLKEINDMLLLHIISFYHQLPYTFKISDDLKSICFKIKK